jgi:hypothetical protein
MFKAVCNNTQKMDDVDQHLWNITLDEYENEANDGQASSIGEDFSPRSVITLFNWNNECIMLSAQKQQ